MTPSPAARTFEVRHVQFARAAFAALAAIMITFSPDHSAAVGAAVFSGFAIATGLVWAVSLWLVYPAGQRVIPGLMALATLAAGMAGGLPPLRTIDGYFWMVILWAAATGVIELVAGVRGLRLASRADKGTLEAAHPSQEEALAAAAAIPRSQSRDALTVGILTLVLAAAMLLVPQTYALDYTIAEAGQSFTLTGITIGVGIFGGYAAIIAVYLAIAGFSPRPTTPAEAPAVARADQENHP
ncbi:acyl-CoA synthetase [Microbacterium hominis]|uniref:Acyl-CoA synthetase n=1 Tax=Microbacterium hominis TaxID=162426 RepID=A0A7D4PVX2_9MICO|nr:acyl-CoA synthetase [Microbacterium hominis]QKJ20933.1 acyl-CoA synthetase [Microbacterium hominis]